MGHSKDHEDADNQRMHMRFRTATPVVVDSDEYGRSTAVMRNISRGGAFLEMAEPLPLGTRVTLHFTGEGDSMEATAHVQHRYSFNYRDGAGPASCRGVGLRFTDFVKDGRAQKLKTPARERILH